MSTHFTNVCDNDTVCIIRHTATLYYELGEERRKSNGSQEMENWACMCFTFTFRGGKFT